MAGSEPGHDEMATKRHAKATNRHEKAPNRHEKAPILT
jgi:hypothetical protein